MPNNKTKALKFAKEQKEILDKLLYILDYTKTKTFLLSELDTDEDKKSKIIALSNDIRNYYPSNKCIGVNGQHCDRPYLSIIRYVLKFHEYHLFSTKYTFKVDKTYIYTQKYTIVQNL